MEGGDKIIDKIHSAIEKSDMFLLIIGRYFSESPTTGKMRLLNKNDLLRYEIETALKLGKIICFQKN
jgi:hypothetical protein